MQNSHEKRECPTQNPHTLHFEQFSNERLMQRLQKKFTPKPYWAAFGLLRAVVLGASFLFHALSAATAAALIFLFLRALIGNNVVAGTLTAAALIALELTKRETAGRLFNSFFQFGKLSPGLAAASVCLMALSTAASYHGAKRAVHEFTPPPATLRADSLAAPLLAQVASIDKQIEAAQRMTWKGKPTSSAQRTLERLARQKETVLAEIARIQQRADGINDRTQAEHATALNLNAAQFGAFTAACELLLLLCLFYLEFFDYRSYAEHCRASSTHPDGEALATGTTGATAGSLAADLLSRPANGNGHHHANGNGVHGEAPERRPIGFHRPPDDDNGMRYRAHDNAYRYDASAQVGEVVEVDKSLKPCAQCGAMFRARTTWQKFCTPDCKLSYHEARHGRPFDPLYKKRPKPA